MSVVCGGCGRRVGAAEVACGACGRPTPGDTVVVGSPTGWTTASVSVDPEARTSLDVDADDGPDMAALFLPAQARHRGVTGDDQAVAADQDRPTGFGAVGATPTPGDPPDSAAAGGVMSPGWRVRLSNRQAEALAAAETEATASGPAPATAAQDDPERTPARLPGWVYPTLVGAIMLTSVVAAVLIAVHVLRTP